MERGFNYSTIFPQINKGECVINSQLAELLGNKVGSTITIVVKESMLETQWQQDFNFATQGLYDYSHAVYNVTLKVVGIVSNTQ